MMGDKTPRVLFTFRANRPAKDYRVVLKAPGETTIEVCTGTDAMGEQRWAQFEFFVITEVQHRHSFTTNLILAAYNKGRSDGGTP